MTLNLLVVGSNPTGGTSFFNACANKCTAWQIQHSKQITFLKQLLMQCNRSRTLQQCLQQRRRNASLQQLYNSGNSVGMGLVGRVTTPTQ